MAETVADRPIAGEELARMSDLGPCELIDGRISGAAVRLI